VRPVLAATNSLAFRVVGRTESWPSIWIDGLFFRADAMRSVHLAARQDGSGDFALELQGGR
jgi:hypothetical protein